MMFTDSAPFITSLLLLTWFGVVPAQAAGCTPPPLLESAIRAHADAATYSQLGGWYANRRQFACAAEAYRAALALRPNSSRLAYLLGLYLYSAGDAEGAVAPLETSIRLAPTVLKPHLILASALESLQRNSESREQLEAALKIDPHSIEALEAFSKFLLAEGKYGDVIELLQSDQLSNTLSANLAEAYLGQGSLDKAEEVLQDAKKKAPKSLQVELLLARVSIQRFHYQEAEKLAEGAIRQHPESEPAQRLYLRTLVLTGNTSVARSQAQKLLAQNPNDFEYLYLTAVMEHDAGDLEAARGHLQKAIEIDPNAFPARFTLGVVLAQLNDPSESKVQLKKALELGATEPEVHLQLGKVLNSLGETEEAKQQLKLYQEALTDQHNRALAASKAGQGDKEMSGGDPHNAVGFYREALAATPSDAHLQFKLAVALHKTGDTAGERTALEKAVELDPDLAVAQNGLGLLTSQSGDPSGAEKHFREAVRTAPEYTEAWVNLAAALGLQSRFKEAGEAVSTALRLDPQNANALLLRDTLAKAQAQR